MSNHRHSGLYQGASKGLVSKDRLLEKFKDSKYYDPATCPVSRMVASSSRSSADSPRTSPKYPISGPSLQGSSHPIPSQFDTALALLRSKKRPEVETRRTSAPLPFREFQENEQTRRPSHVQYAVCRGMLLRQLESIEGDCTMPTVPAKHVNVVESEKQPPKSAVAEWFQATPPLPEGYRLEDEQEPSLDVDDGEDNESCYSCDDDCSSTTSDGRCFSVADHEQLPISKCTSYNSSPRPDSVGSSLYPKLLDDVKRPYSSYSSYSSHQPAPQLPSLQTIFDQPSTRASSYIAPRSTWASNPDEQCPSGHSASNPTPGCMASPICMAATLTSPFMLTSFSALESSPTTVRAPSRQDSFSPVHRNTTYSEFDRNPYREEDWEDDDVDDSIEAEYDSVLNVLQYMDGTQSGRNVKRQGSKKSLRRGKTVKKGGIARGGTLRRGAANKMLKKNPSFEKAGLKRQDTVAAFLDYYGPEETAMSPSDLPPLPALPTAYAC